MDASSVWSPSRDPRELLDAADTVAVYTLDSATAIPLLPIVEEHFSDARNPGPRELLFRGLIRLLAQWGDDSIARPDYVAALQLVGDDTTLRLRIVLRLVHLSSLRRRGSEVAEWLDVAHQLSGSVNEPHLLAELAYWWARHADDRRSADVVRRYEMATTLAFEAGSMERWLACRVHLAKVLIKNGHSYGGPALLELAESAVGLGVGRHYVVRQLLDLAAQLQVASDPTPAHSWIGSLSEDDLAYTGTGAELAIGQILVRIGRWDKAITFHAHRATLPYVSAETRWLSKLLHLGLLAQRDADVIPSLIDHVDRWREAEVAPLRRVVASGILHNVSAYGAAESLLREMDADPRVSPDLRSVVRLGIATVLSDQGRLTEARGIFDSIPRDAEAGDPEFEGTWLITASLLAGAEGLDEVAAEYSVRALSIFRRQGTVENFGVAAVNAVAFETNVDQREFFIRELREMLPLLTGRLRAHACLVMAERLSDRGNLSEAISLVEDAFCTATALRDHRAAAVAVITTGWLLLEHDRPGATQAFADVARNFSSELDLHALALYGSAFVALGSPGARKLMTHAARALDSSGRTWLAAIAWHLTADETRDAARAITFGRRGFRTMLRVVAQCVDPRLRALALERMRPVGAALVRRQLSAGDATPALETTYRLKSADAIRPVPGSVEIDPALAEALRNAMEPRAIASSFVRAAFRGAPIVNAVRDAGRVAELLARNDPRIRDARIRASAVQRRLGPREAAVEYLVLRDEREVVLFVMTKERITALRRRWTAEHDEAARVVGAVIAGRHHGGAPAVWVPMLRMLDDILLAPLRRPLRGIERLWLAPGGYLANVPFHALLDRRLRPALVRMDLRLLVSTAQLAFLPRRRRHPKRAAVLRGDDTGFPPLPSADLEHARASSALQGAGISLTDDAADFQSADVIHYAGHAHFDADLSTTTLPLAGRKLSDDDLARIKLPRRPLLVLSACESGRAMPSVDTMTGMLRAAFAAGVRDVVVSGWSAEDASTAALMERFYRHLLNGEGPATALRASAREVRALADHPFFWANFRCYGLG